MYKLEPEHGPYCHGLWVADAECVDCKTKYTAWVGPAEGNYGRRVIDINLIEEHGFYDLSYRSTFNDEPGKEDIPLAKVETFRVVRIHKSNGDHHDIWYPIE